MTSSVELDRLVNKVLRAPRAMRWDTLLNAGYDHDCPFILNELVDRFARSERALEDSKDAVRIQAEELVRLTKAIEDFCRHFNVVPKWGESWSVAGFAGVKAQYAQLQQDLKGRDVSLEERDSRIARLEAEKAKLEAELTTQRLNGQDMCTELANARADNSVLREALAIAQKAKESWPQDVEQIEQLKKELTELRTCYALSKEARTNWETRCIAAELAATEAKADVIYERANANNLGVSLTKLQLQANGWKEENEQLKKALDTAKADALTEADRLRRMLDGRDKRITELCCQNSLAQVNYENAVKERDQLRKELDERPIGGYYINDLVTAQEEKERLLVLNEELAKENERAKIAIAEKNRMLDERMARINELNAGIARAQDVRQDRQTDARLFLELIHLGRTVNDARAILAAANDIRKNGLTPQT